MKTVFTLLIALLAFPSIAVEIEFIGPCSSTPLFATTTYARYQTVGDLTIHILDKNRIPYIGNEEGLNSIFRTPVGMDAIDVISDTVMRSYGWCFYVDGELAQDYADTILINSPETKIQWVYSYATLVKDKWVSMCNPAHRVQADFLCKKKSNKH